MVKHFNEYTHKMMMQLIIIQDLCFRTFALNNMKSMPLNFSVNLSISFHSNEFPEKVPRTSFNRYVVAPLSSPVLNLDPTSRWQHLIFQ